MGVGLGAGFFATVLFFSCVAFFIPFFLRAGATRFAFFDFFAMVNLLIGSTQIRRPLLKDVAPRENHQQDCRHNQKRRLSCSILRKAGTIVLIPLHCHGRSR
jgi:hypothetical protein